MKSIRKWILMLAAFPLAFASCNKDEEIIMEIPDETPSDLSFTVVEYLPAPGQFINEKVSGFDGIATMEQACAYAQERLESLGYVSLGAWGGRLTVKASTPIANSGGYDFAIGGNAFDTSNEPGIVWVLSDTNGNGLPDDAWYELKGSHYGMEGYEKDYWVTYFRPATAKSDVRWEDSDGATGTVSWMGTFHSQDFYYPSWVSEDSYTLHGSRLPDRTYQDPKTGNWGTLPFKWGYADNNGEDSEIASVEGRTVQKNYFRISDAVDADGNPTSLERIDFIRVQTAVNGKIGILGENSTEICGFFRQ